MDLTTFDPDNFAPSSNHVLIRRRPADERTTSGKLVLPNTENAATQEIGDVLAVGPGALHENGNRMPMTLKAGDVVIIDELAGHQYEVAGAHYVIIRENHVPAVIDEAA